EIFGVPFDLGRLEIRGTPMALLHDVAANMVAAMGRYDFTSSGAETAIFGYPGGRPDSVASRLMWIDAGTPAPFTKSGTPLAAGALSPDGNLFASTAGSIGNVNVVVYDVRREIQTPITNSPQSYRDVAWAPDGKHIVYSLQSSGGGQVWWARADGGSEPRKL